MKSRSRDRVEEIFKKVNVDKLPFKINPEKLNELGVDIAEELRVVFKGINMCPALKWCLSTVKKAKVFTLIYRANELGLPIYKEEIAKKLPEYSYKTVAQIVDEGIAKGFFINLKSSDKSKIYDKKIHNIRPSEELVADFINWNIDAICILKEFYNTKKKVN